MVYHYWYFSIRFNSCHNLTMLCLNLSNITIATAKCVDYCCIIYNISKSHAITFLKNLVLDDRGYTQNAFQRNQ